MLPYVTAGIIGFLLIWLLFILVLFITEPPILDLRKVPFFLSLYFCLQSFKWLSYLIWVNFLLHNSHCINPLLSLLYKGLLLLVLTGEELPILLFILLSKCFFGSSISIFISLLLFFSALLLCIIALSSLLWFSHFDLFLNPFAFFVGGFSNFSLISLTFGFSISFFPWNTRAHIGTCLAYASLLNFLPQFGHSYLVSSFTSSSSTFGITSVLIWDLFWFEFCLFWFFVSVKFISKEIAFFFIWVFVFMSVSICKSLLFNPLM